MTQTDTTGRILAVASGKGGVGKTVFSIALAHALARRGRQVLLFDGDLGLANVDIQLGLTPPHDLGAVIAGRVEMAKAVLPYAPGGFDILAGRSGSGALATLDPGTLDRLVGGLRGLARGYDVTLLDLGAGLDRGVRRLSSVADTLLVLAIDEPTSLTDAYAVLKMDHADRAGGDTRVVVNQAANRGAGERTYATLHRACATFLGRAPALAGVIRRDERVRDAIRRQSLLLTRHPSCPASIDIERVALALEDATRATPEPARA